MFCVNLIIKVVAYLPVPASKLASLSHLYIKAVFRKKQNTSNSTQKNISKKNVSEALLQRNTNCGQKYKCTATRKACAVGYVDH